ncbi:MAG: hypothetical protein PHR81_09925 [Bacteroidales bacterium]|jgi:hypothetical protein|nr:hypothetical protein [Bacteroidales bacterium]MDD4215118.1 hypothetical protein [Bacteroidales bacterium]
MGGQEGSRGYLFQAVISAFNSLNDDKWTYVQIEPLTEYEKVDISWEYPNSQRKVVQVKSSINPFSKSDIISWATALYNDINDALSYEIILIGTVSDAVQEAIKKSNKKEEALDSFLKPIIDKLIITIKNYDPDSLKSNVSTSLNKFISDQGFNANFYTIDKIADSIVLQFLFLSISGTKISRSTFEDKILEWLRFNFATIFGKVYNNRLDISFYNAEEKLFQKEISELRYENLTDLPLVFDEKRIIEDLINEISHIQIISSTKPQRRSSLSSLYQNHTSISEWSDAGFSIKDQGKISALIEKYFNRKIDAIFFDVGNLVQPSVRVISSFGDRKPDYTGSDSEKLKKTKLDELYKKLIGLEDLCTFLIQFENFQIIPLALQNLGGVHDEKIRVLIKLPKSVTVLKHNQISPPSSLENLKKFNDDYQLIEDILKCSCDSNVKEDTTNYFHSQTLDLDFMESEQNRINNKQSIFTNVVSCIFNFTFLEVIDNNQILEFSFKELNPKENLLFPCYLFIKSDNDFSIKYEITSKYLSEKTVGELLYNVNKNS